MPRTRRNRSRARGVTAIEAAAAFAIVGSLLAVAVPVFVRELRASRFVEPVSGLKSIGRAAVAFAHTRPASDAFPPSVGLTPEAPPRGVLAPDPPGIWEHETWRALGFRPVPEGVPHAFAFAFESVPGESGSRFVARAHGDLDGDGVVSTFEVRGHALVGEDGARLEPGMYIESELE
jgi:hypothetical protein